MKTSDLVDYLRGEAYIWDSGQMPGKDLSDQLRKAADAIVYMRVRLKAAETALDLFKIKISYEDEDGT